MPKYSSASGLFLTTLKTFEIWRFILWVKFNGNRLDPRGEFLKLQPRDTIFGLPVFADNYMMDFRIYVSWHCISSAAVYRNHMLICREKSLFVEEEYLVIELFNMSVSTDCYQEETRNRSTFIVQHKSFIWWDDRRCIDTFISPGFLLNICLFGDDENLQWQTE